jgi:hypothetical protein
VHTKVYLPPEIYLFYVAREDAPIKKRGKKMVINVQLILLAFGAVLAFLLTIALGRKGLENIEYFKKHTAIPLVVTIIAGVLIATAVMAAGNTDVRNWLTSPLAAPAAPSGGPTKTVLVGNVGEVLASVNDALKLPTTPLVENVFVSLQQPLVGGATWNSVADDTTGSNGSVMIDVTGVTSGSVYVTSGGTGYYSNYTTTTIPGPQVIPTTSATVNLVKVGTLSVTLDTDNSYARLTGPTTITIDNGQTAIFTLKITTSVVWTAIKDLQLVEIQGAAYTTSGAVISPAVTQSGGTTVSGSGDPTLTSAVTGGWGFGGNLVFGQTIKITYTITTSGAKGLIATINLNDLNGSTGYLGETGIAATSLTVTSV